MTRSTKWRRRTNPEPISFTGVGLQGRQRPESGLQKRVFL